ncbi:Uncharacterized membrane protein YdjX, TVP38/TMEM64 family, SNARE-associated domain [Dethiosulfatibacter aminovorans DSM 17477]|uniref:TVP38/TMEM64 family membrane protein n=1 Tax=Dethiosulfatibacter aminovorans DSM 17477 TaxID=1121476 RepID=A0A1M6K0S2_9FIRM|nr:VTT domain-containing protein [Dethiosulfatibacter aminovorans]SHJ52545.1 Uncharacterized membrane protein YdjX, TVP38/TMEM64 family, SNARE-associated domain [Dethiosulfatibacter aminovorans DSM 17477]
MEYEFLLKYMSQENIDLVINFIDRFGVLAGIGLPVLESFIPLLPLVLFVTLNVFFFGFFGGYMLSWIGNCAGSILLFMFIRYIRRKRHMINIRKDTRYHRIKKRISDNDFTFLFVLLCFPFTPSSVVTLIAAVSDIKLEHFIIALLPSKLIMVLSLAFIGFNISSFWENPARSIVFLASILIINMAGKRFMEFYHKKYEED